MNLIPIMHRILNSYLRRLTNLTSRNKSLLLLRLVSGRFLDVNEFDFLNNKPAFSIVEQLIARKKEVFLCRVLDSRDETNNKVSQKLRKIWRSDRFVFVHAPHVRHAYTCKRAHV